MANVVQNIANSNLANAVQNNAVQANPVQTGEKAIVPEVTFQEPGHHESPVELFTISNVQPMNKTTACGKPVWTLYAVANGKRLPIRVVVENGQRKLHLFDFIQAMTGCDDNSKVNEWNRLHYGLEEAIMTKIMMAQKYRFPELHRDQLTKSDSIVVDIFQVTKIALAIGKRAQWFTEILVSLGNRFMAGDLDLAADVEYMHIAQQLITEYEPDNFLRLWGEEFLYNTQAAQREREVTNPETIIGSTTEKVQTVMDKANVTRIKLRRKRHRSQSRPRKSDSDPDSIGSVYSYEIKVQFKTREEALAYLKNRGITRPLPQCIIICKDDLKGKYLIKIGKTEFSTRRRQINYTRPLSKSKLYNKDLEQRKEHPIKFISKLTEIENQVKDAIFTEEAVGLIRDDGTIYYPDEIFLVDSIESAQQLVKQTIDKIQMGRPIHNQMDSPEVVKLNQMKETTRQLELKMQMHTQTLQMLERMGASKDDVVKVLMSNSSN